LGSSGDRVCQHQKSWIIDAGAAGETTFVGGINCNPQAVVERGHPELASTHDLYVEVAGPSATDVHHNFVQRWNGASEAEDTLGQWPATGTDDLAFPTAVSPPAGDSAVQIQRTMPARTAWQPIPTPGGEPFPIQDGERSVLGQYLAAIGAAQRTIYIENQYLAEENIIRALDDACGRGVVAIVVVPAEPDGGSGVDLRALRSSLTRHPGFALVGLEGLGPDGVLRGIYVHDKVMIVDDEWSTIGSANIHRPSMHGHAEINAAIWDPFFSKALRVALFAEHLGIDTTDMSGIAAARLFADVATESAATVAQERRGLAIRLDPALY